MTDMHRTFCRIFSHVLARFRDRPDTEHQQAFIRVVIGGLLSLYFLPQALADRSYMALSAIGIFLLVILSIPVWIYFRPGVSITRRMYGMIEDMMALSAAMILFGDHGLALYVLFISITSANGFRFGSKYLLATLPFGIIGLAVAAPFSSLFHGRPALAAELIFAYVCVSLYVNSLVRQLHGAVRDANQASEAKKQFLSAMSHELRTPLHTIAGLSELLGAKVRQHEEKILTASIDTAVSHMLSLVNDVLDFSKIESGKIEVEQSVFHVDLLIASVSHLYAKQAELKGLQFRARMSLDVPSWIVGDQQRIQQVLGNFLSNAVKFTDKGEVGLAVELTGSDQGARFIKWTITDTGIGVPEHMQTKIFDSFIQADSSVSRKYGGTGLGTTIARQLTQLMGGDVGVESDGKTGSTFWFTIPCHAHAEPDMPKQPAWYAPLLLVNDDSEMSYALAASCKSIHPSVISDRSTIAEVLRAAQPYTIGMLTFAIHGFLPTEARLAIAKGVPVLVFSDSDEHNERIRKYGALAICSDLSRLPRGIQMLAAWFIHHSEQGQSNGRAVASMAPKQILIADDNQVNTRILKQILENEGHSVVHAADGEELLDKLEEWEPGPDLIILDMNMPRMSGIEATRLIRFMHHPKRKTPIVMLTADATVQARREAINAGVTDFITKPIAPSKLLQRLKQLFPEEIHDMAKNRFRQNETPADQSACKPAVLNNDAIEDLRLISGKPAFLESLILDFIDDVKILDGKMQSAVEDGNFAGWRDAMHALIASTQSLGLERLTEALANANTMDFQLFSQSGATAMARIREEYRLAEAALLRVISDGTQQ